MRYSIRSSSTVNVSVGYASVLYPACVVGKIPPFRNGITAGQGVYYLFKRAEKPLEAAEYLVDKINYFLIGKAVFRKLQTHCNDGENLVSINGGINIEAAKILGGIHFFKAACISAGTVFRIRNTIFRKRIAKKLCIAFNVFFHSIASSSITLTKL